MKMPIGAINRKGLTLVEVLLAVAILGAGMSALLLAASRCLAVFKIARMYQEAQWVLGLGELEYPLKETEHIEDLEVDDVSYPNGFTFSREIEDDEDEDDLWVVRTRVTWSANDRQGKEEVVRYFYHVENP